MYFAAVFVIFLRISFGFRLQFGIDQLFHAVGVDEGNIKPRVSLKEPRSIKSNETTSDKTNETTPTNTVYNNNGVSKNPLPGFSVVNESIDAISSESLGEVGKTLNESLSAIVKVPRISEELLQDGIPVKVAEGEVLNENLSQNGKVPQISEEVLNDGVQTKVTGSEPLNESLSATTKVSGISKDSHTDDIEADKIEYEALKESLSTNSKVSGSSEDALNDAIQVKTAEGNESISSNPKVPENSKGSLKDGNEGKNVPVRKGFFVYPLKAVIPDLRSLKYALKDAIQKTDEVIRKSFSVIHLKTVKSESSKKDKTVQTEAANNTSLSTTNGTSGNGSVVENNLKQAAEEECDPRSKSQSAITNVAGNFDKDSKDGSLDSEDAINKSYSADQFPESTVEESCNSRKTVTSFANVPAVTTFVDTFNFAVKSSEILTVLFDMNEATPDQFSQLKYRYLADMFRRLGSVENEIIAEYATRHVAKYFEALSPQLLIRIYGNAFANLLFADGILTEENAEDLCLEYVQTLAEAAEANGVSCDCDYPRKIQAVVDGVTCFLITYDQLSSFKAWQAVFYYAHEWLLAANDYANLKSLAIKK